MTVVVVVIVVANCHALRIHAEELARANGIFLIQTLLMRFPLVRLLIIFCWRKCWLSPRPLRLMTWHWSSQGHMTVPPRFSTRWSAYREEGTTKFLHINDTTPCFLWLVPGWMKRGVPKPGFTNLLRRWRGHLPSELNKIYVAVRQVKWREKPNFLSSAGIVFMITATLFTRQMYVRRT